LDKIIKFGAYELDTETGELRKHGVRLKLADQPFRLLTALLDRPGELVTREELKQRIWGGEEFGDFEQGLNRIVGKLRDVLSDRASESRFVETLPGRGYRFVCPIDRPPLPTPEVEVVVPNRRRRWLLVGAPAVCLLLFVWLALRFLVLPAVPTLRWRKLTADSLQKTPPALSDGTRIYVMATYSGEQSLVQVPLEGGQPTRLAVTLPGPYATLQDISADGQELLITASGTTERYTRVRPLWALRISDGRARRLGAIVATSATYGSKSGMIAYTAGPELWVALENGENARKLLEAKGKLLDSISVAPDDIRIRFAERDELSGKSSAWEVHADGSGLRQVFPGWNLEQAPMGWTPDGQIGLFGGGGMIWGEREPYFSLPQRQRMPVPLLTDSPEFLNMTRVRSASAFHAIGIDRLAELQRYDSRKKSWTPLLDGLSADAAEYSRDGQRLAYVAYPQRTLWVRQADGSKPIQLTSPPYSVTFPRWSPDGRLLVFNAQEAPNKPIRLFTVDSAGGLIRPVLASDQGSQGYASWSPDGKNIAYGVQKFNTSDPAIIRIVEVSSGKVSKVDGSEGLYAPRWSPDGKMIAAQQRATPGHLMLYDVAEHRWYEVSGGTADWPTWEPDSSSILFQTERALMRYRIANRKLEQIAETEPISVGNTSHCVGVMPDGAPIRTLDHDSRQLYELRFESR
jgi:Tol biopolymer transport system component/DNA-binding winged helix-turn-helix (wHTH) protein